MTKKALTISVLLAIVAATGALVFAQKAHGGFGRHGMRGPGRGMGMVFRQLNLSDEQKSKVKEILAANKAAVKPIFEEMRANHAKLADLKGNDDAQVAAIAKSQGDLTAQMIVAGQKVKSEIFAILTDEQKAKAEQLRTEM